MGLLNLFLTNINDGVTEFNNTSNSVLIDVREKDEYFDGHINGSINIPLSRISDISKIISDKNKNLFVYCHSGSRSGRAVSFLKANGYKNVKNIGGICSYKGTIMKGNAI